MPGVLCELLRQVPRMPEVVGPQLRAFLDKPNYTSAEELAMALIEHVSPSREIPALTNHIPTGFFDNASLERWLRRSLEKIAHAERLPRVRAQARPAALHHRLRPRHRRARDLRRRRELRLTISQAVQASTALPIFYKPARINGVDYVDGGMRHTANIDVAIEKGADLIICYNPFRPVPEPDRDEEGAQPLLRGGPLPLGPRPQDA